MEAILFKSDFVKTVLKIEVVEYYNFFDKQYYKKFDNSDYTNMYYQIPYKRHQEAILLASVLLKNGIWCKVTDCHISLGAAYNQGNILVMPIKEITEFGEKYYLQFIVKA